MKLVLKAQFAALLDAAAVDEVNQAMRVVTKLPKTGKDYTVALALSHHLFDLEETPNAPELDEP